MSDLTFFFVLVPKSHPFLTSSFLRISSCPKLAVSIPNGLDIKIDVTCKSNEFLGFDDLAWDDPVT